MALHNELLKVIFDLKFHFQVIVFSKWLFWVLCTKMLHYVLCYVTCSVTFLESFVRFCTFLFPYFYVFRVPLYVSPSSKKSSIPQKSIKMRQPSFWSKYGQRSPNFPKGFSYVHRFSTSSIKDRAMPCKQWLHCSQTVTFSVI